MLTENIYLNKTAILHLLLLYFLTNFFLLLNFQGIYWDDWVIFSQKPETILSIFSQTGSILMGYLHVILQQIGNGIYIYRITSFLAFFLSGIFIFFILRKVKYFDTPSVFFITLFFLLAPVNDARIALVNATPVLILFVFYLAFFLVTLYLNKKKVSLRCLILLLFFIAFSVESLLIFYAIVLLYIFYNIAEKKPKEKISSLLQSFFSQYLDFICLPFLFFALKHYFIRPSGLYIGYNSLHLDLHSFFSLLWRSLTTSFYQPLILAIRTAWTHLSLTLAVLILLIFTLRQRISLAFNKDTFPTKILLMGIVFFLLAVIPYCAVGKLPQMEHWDSRNQLLIPLGMALIIYSIVLFSKFIHKKLPSILTYVIVSVFIVQGLHSYYLYDMDWFYQVSLMEQFKYSKIMHEHTTFIAKDNLEMDVWATKRGLSFYEINGLLKKTFNEDTRLVVHDISSITSFQQYRNYPQYNFSHWTAQLPTYIEFSKNKSILLTGNKRFLLFFDSIFNPKTFRKNTKKLTKVTCLSSNNINSRDKVREHN